MSKFKVGDRVRNMKTSEYVNKGVCGTVDQNNSRSPYIKWDNGETWARCEEYLELIKEPERENSKDGNFKVRGIANHSNWITKGKIYDFKNGKVTYDNGFCGESCYKNFDSYKEANPNLSACFELLQDKPIITIEVKGRHTIATLKNGDTVIRTAKATCNPSDTWNDEIGQKLAFERLMGYEIKDSHFRIDSKGNITTSSRLIVKQDKYEVGDKVKLVSNLPSNWNHSGLMDKFLGKIVTIKAIRGSNFTFDGSEKWSFLLCNIEGKVIETTVKEESTIDWESFKSGKFAVHCDTEEKAREFLNKCNDHGVKWCNGRNTVKQVETQWNSYKQKTSYGCDGQGGLMFGTFDETPKIDYTPSKPTVKEVKRPAKVGEWVKILRVDSFTEEDHKVGDIFQAIKCTNGRSTNSAYYANRNDGCGYVNFEDYVVLENYQPDTKSLDSKPVEPFRKAKVGDKIKIVKVKKSGHNFSCEIGEVQLVINADKDGVSVENENFYWDKDQEYIIIDEPQQSIDLTKVNGADLYAEVQRRMKSNLRRNGSWCK